MSLAVTGARRDVRCGRAYQVPSVQPWSVHILESIGASALIGDSVPEFQSRPDAIPMSNLPAGNVEALSGAD